MTLSRRNVLKLGIGAGAVSLLDSFSVAIVCRELHLSAGDLRKHRQALDARAERSVSAPSPFVELRAVDLAPQASVHTPPADESAAAVRAVVERGDGARLTLELPTAAASLLEALVTT